MPMVSFDTPWKSVKLLQKNDREKKVISMFHANLELVGHYEEKKKIERKRLEWEEAIFITCWIYLVFLHRHSRFTGQQMKEKGTLYHFHSFQIHLNINRAITVGSSPLYIGSSRTWTRVVWVPRASHKPLN